MCQQEKETACHRRDNIHFLLLSEKPGLARYSCCYLHRLVIPILRERSEQASEIWSAHRPLSRRVGAPKVEPRIGAEVGVSVSTIDRVKTILKEGSYEQIKALKNKSQRGGGPKVRTVYEQVQQEAIKV